MKRCSISRGAIPKRSCRSWAKARTSTPPSRQTRIQGRYTEAELPELGEGEDIDTSLPADPDVKNYSYTVVDGAVYYRENSRMVRPDLNATAEARVKGLVELRDCVQRLIDLEMNASMPDAAIREQMAELNRHAGCRHPGTDGGAEPAL